MSNKLKILYILVLKYKKSAQEFLDFLPSSELHKSFGDDILISSFIGQDGARKCLQLRDYSVGYYKDLVSGKTYYRC